MNQNNKQYTLLTREFYRDRIRRVIDENSCERRAKQVGWHSYTIQSLGFENATNFSEIDWKSITSILDVGCGYGTLVKYLREERKFVGKYTGIEIVPEFIKEAEQLYGKDPRNKFISGNFFTQKWEEKYDLVISLGILAVNYDWPNKYGEKTIFYADKAIMLIVHLAQIGMSISFPNQNNCATLIIEMNSNMAFYQPREIRQMIDNASSKRCKNLTIESYPDCNSIRGIARVSFVESIESVYSNDK